MKKVRILLFCIAIFLLGATFCGCSLFDGDIEYDTVTYEDYANNTMTILTNKTKEIDISDNVSESEREENISLLREHGIDINSLNENEDYEVSYELRSATSSYDEICTMGANDDILYPGALLNIKNNNYKALGIDVEDRGSITISANLETGVNVGSNTLSETIDQPAKSSVTNGIRQIITRNIGETTQLPSVFQMSIHEVSSAEEFFMGLGLGFQVKKFAFSDNYSTNNIEKQTNLVVVLKQIYYTISVDDKSAKGFFSDNARSKDINKKLEGTIPAYVAAVSYGRLVMLGIQTDYTQQDVENILKQSWGKMSDNPGSSSNKKFSETFETSVKNLTTDNSTDISYFVYGGNSSVSGSLKAEDSLADFFSGSDNDYYLGMPISYRIRHLDGELAKIQSADTYVVKNVEYKPKKLMDWSSLKKIIEDQSIKKIDKLNLDLSGVVEYDLLNVTDDNANKYNANQIIRVPENISELTISGPNATLESVLGQIEYNGLTISVAPRNTPLTITLKDINFNGFNNAAIKTDDIDSQTKINLCVKGSVTLKGAKGYSAISAYDFAINSDQQDSGILTIEGGCGNVINGEYHVGNGIDAERLTINAIGNSISIKGGDSVLYEYNGRDGGIGVNVSGEVSITTEAPVLISGGKGAKGGVGNGYNRDAFVDGNGASGGIGGTGGNGGHAIKATSLRVNATKNSVILRGGDGGQGGDGGDGQSSTWEKKITYKAGKGGVGGRGGDAGKVFKISEEIVPAGIVIQLASNGKGGTGGNGGNAKKTKKAVGNDWHCSQPGEGGEGGVAGTYYDQNEYDGFVVDSKNSGAIIGVGDKGENGVQIVV